MTTPAPEGAPPINHRWTAGPGDVRRLSGALTRAGLTDRRQLVSLAVVVAVIGGGLVLLFALGDVTFAVGGLAGLIGATGALLWRTARTARTHFERIAFPGAHWAVGYGRTSLVLYQPISSAVIDYGHFTGVRRGQDRTVLLRYTDSRLVVVLPDELCPPPAFDYLADAIRRRRTG